MRWRVARSEHRYPPGKKSTAFPISCNSGAHVGHSYALTRLTGTPGLHRSTMPTHCDRGAHHSSRRRFRSVCTEPQQQLQQEVPGPRPELRGCPGCPGLRALRSPGRGPRTGSLSPAQPPGAPQRPRGPASMSEREGRKEGRSPPPRSPHRGRPGGDKHRGRTGQPRRPSLTGSGVSTTSLTASPMQGRHCPMASPGTQRPRGGSVGRARPGLGPAGAEAGTGTCECPR